MESNSEAVFNFVHENLQNNSPCWLFTVIQTWGSSPRLPGACLAWSRNGGTSGSLSGGCIEDDLLAKCQDDHFNNQEHPFLLTYGVTREDAERFGLPCGGKLELLAEYLPCDPSTLAHIKAIQEAISQRKCITRHVQLTSSWASSELYRVSYDGPQELNQTSDSINYYLGPQFRLLIVGANQVAQYLADFTRALDFEIWVCDPRENAFRDWPHGFTRNFSQMPDDLIREKAHDKHTAVVTVSHDPRVDDMALMEALTTDAFYIGAMGSRKTTDARVQRLLQLDLTPVQIEKLRAPIGLPIGSKTPAEIAMAIAADLVRTIRTT